MLNNVSNEIGEMFDEDLYLMVAEEMQLSLEDMVLNYIVNQGEQSVLWEIIHHYVPRNPTDLIKNIKQLEYQVLISQYIEQHDENNDILLDNLGKQLAVIYMDSINFDDLQVVLAKWKAAYPS